MPKSKRSKLVSLTKTGKKGKENKEELLKNVQENTEKWDYVYIFRIGKMRSEHIQTVRKLWKGDGRFFFGKCAVMSKALGDKPETEHRQGLHKIAQRLKGQTGLFFTSYDPTKVDEWFEDFKAPDFARAGNVADRDVILPVGPIHRTTEPPEPFPHNMDPQLRALGLKTSLVRGVPTLTSEHVVCRKGQKLTTEQAQLLKLLLIQMVTFKVKLYARWDAKTGVVTELRPDDEEVTPAAATEEEGAEEMSE
ncbi:hypothetical protein M422DRAFT_24777 [Sphaerobolus stellatus SS14]|nr:hypothetical protein M422DRAFT_24777 [Sphaerobolus stellatus SS14]